MDPATRIEHDTLGEMEVPASALYGSQTARAMRNFPISGWPMPEPFLRVLARIKACFARANCEVGLLAPDVSRAIADAADAVAAGGYPEQFPVDVFQTGSGTSTNMNMNEVLAHLANRALGGDPVGYRPIHPNDHVNLGQSSNDVIPAALRITAAVAWRDMVRPRLDLVVGELGRLAERHAATVTLGRTHLMDAVPTTYGRIFGAWRERLSWAGARADASATGLLSLPLGGTAVGTGLSCRPEAARRVVELLAADTGLPLALADNAATGIAAQEEPIAFADALAQIARATLAIANDLRLRASGPFGGLAEVVLPAVQPGSSIMPGKVNPVIPEAVVQAAIQIEGLASACRATVWLHQLELSHANPLLAWNLDTMARLLTGALLILAERSLSGLEIDHKRARRLAEASPALATALASRIGYERAAAVAQEARASGEGVRATALRLGVLATDEVDAVLDVSILAGVKKT